MTPEENAPLCGLPAPRRELWAQTQEPLAPRPTPRLLGRLVHRPRACRAGYPRTRRGSARPGVLRLAAPPPATVLCGSAAPARSGEALAVGPRGEQPETPPGTGETQSRSSPLPMALPTSSLSCLRCVWEFREIEVGRGTERGQRAAENWVKKIVGWLLGREDP